MLSRDTAPSGVRIPFLGQFLHFLGGNGGEMGLNRDPTPWFSSHGVKFCMVWAFLFFLDVSSTLQTSMISQSLGQYLHNLVHFCVFISHSSNIDDKIKVWVNSCTIWSNFLPVFQALQMSMISKVWVKICPVQSIFCPSLTVFRFWWEIKQSLGQNLHNLVPFFAQLSNSSNIDDESNFGSIVAQFGPFFAHLSQSSDFSDKSNEVWVNICTIWSIFLSLSHTLQI